MFLDAEQDYDYTDLRARSLWSVFSQPASYTVMSGPYHFARPEIYYTKDVTAHLNMELVTINTYY